MEKETKLDNNEKEPLSTPENLNSQDCRSGDGESPKENRSLLRMSDEEIANSLFRTPPVVRTIRRRREVVSISSVTNKWVRTNDSGKEILDLCNGVMTVKEIAGYLASKYDMPEEVILSLVINTVRGGLRTHYLILSSKRTLNLWLNLTDQCNMKCPFCFRGDPKASDTHALMTVDKWCNAIEDLSYVDSLSVTISGGEPTLFPELDYLLDMLQSQPNINRVSLLTNGTGVSQERYIELAKKVSILQISLDGVSPETNDKIRGDGNFERVRKLLEFIRDNGCDNVMLSFTPTRYNLEDMPKMIRFALNYNLAGLHVNKLNLAGRAIDRFEEIKVTPQEQDRARLALFKQYEAVFGQVGKYRQKAGMQNKKFFLDVDTGATKFVFRPTTRFSCGMGRAHMSISPYGDITPCTAFCSEAGKAYIFGNVQDDVSIQVIHSKMATAMQKIAVDDVASCSGCELVHLCAGGCRARALNFSGDILGEDPLCAKERLIDNLFSIRAVASIPVTYLKECAEKTRGAELKERYNLKG